MYSRLSSSATSRRLCCEAHKKFDSLSGFTTDCRLKHVLNESRSIWVLTTYAVVLSA